MKVLVTGTGGQLGYDVVKALVQRGHEPIGADVAQMDITNKDQVDAFMRASGAQVVIHCAAYTAVDGAQDEADLCYKVNVSGTENIAKTAKVLGMKMIYISTDYVFAGDGEAPWEVDDPRAPKNVYGQTKLEGEEVVKKLLDRYFIVRISWVFGINGKNFVKTMLNLAKTRPNLSVVNDQFGSPTYTADLAPLLCDMAESEAYGTYHGTNEGICTWYEFAKEIFKCASVEVHVSPVDSSAFPVKAERPKNSRMSKASLDSAGFKRLPPWQDALARYLVELEKSES